VLLFCCNNTTGVNAQGSVCVCVCVCATVEKLVHERVSTFV